MAAVLGVAGCGSHHSGSTAGGTSTPTATLSPSATATATPTRTVTSTPSPIAQVASCAELTSVVISETVIASATLVAADPNGNGMPENCLVRGEIAARTGVTNPDTGSDHYGTSFEVRLPTDWNGRLFYQGGSGADGVVATAIGVIVGSHAIQTPALRQGFAVVSSNGGHKSGIIMAGFGVDPQARIDYGYNSIGQVTPVAKTLIAAYYGRPVAHSYFLGCSKGGQEAMQASQRYGDQFDGIVAGDPGFDLPRVAIAQAWDTQALAAAAEAVSPDSVDDSGHPLLYASLSPAALRFITDRVLEACDELDGLRDGMIFNQHACARTFDPATLRCTGEQNDSCLAPAQLAALQKVFGGARDSRGTQLYADWPYDSGIGSIGWSLWKIGTQTDEPVNSGLSTTLGINAIRYLFTTPPDSTLDVFTLDIDSLARGIYATGVDPISGIEYGASAVDFMTADSTMLDPFKDHGGKLIIYHGVSDPVFSANDTVRYYDQLTKAYGDRTSGFARLFLVPGMNHCAGGDYAVDTFDTLTAIVDWVENGRAPDRLLATAGSPPAGMSRPLCPYPQFAQYDGSGDADSASSFHCVAPCNIHRLDGRIRMRQVEAAKLRSVAETTRSVWGTQ